eukprot:scaffold250610_cov30-Tisochrysis_lutea.AAC.3
MCRVSICSAASHLTTRISHPLNFFSFAASELITLPPRAASTKPLAPLSASHFPVSKPRPPVPPESKWVDPNSGSTSGNAARRCKRGTEAAPLGASAISGSDFGRVDATSTKLFRDEELLSRWDTTALGASARTVRDSPSRPPIHKGIGRAVRSCLAKRSAPSAIGRAPTFDEERSAAEKATAAAAFSNGEAAIETEEPDNGETPAPPMRRAVGTRLKSLFLKTSHPVMYMCDDRGAMGCTSDFNTRLSKPSSLPSAVVIAP